MTIFPIIQPEAEETAADRLPICREIAWDFARGTPVFSGGRPVEVTGAEAVKVWVWKTLMTERYRFEIYTWDYGSELQRLIGQTYDQAVKESEAARYVREALLINPYITAVTDISASFLDARLTVTCTVNTIYGEVDVNV